MTAIQRQLMECLRAYRRGETARALALTAPEWGELYALAADHKLTAVVHETLRTAPGFCGGDAALAARWKRDTILQAAGQAARTRKLLEVTGAFQAQGLPYAVVKGAVCRSLYQNPDLRQSGDEDLFIPDHAREGCSAALAELGFRQLTEQSEGAVDHWQEERAGLHIELHRALLSTGWTAEKVLNPFLAGALEQAVPHTVEGRQILTLPPTAHFLFLIAHAMKHFITGGFGVRTLSDILSFGERYASDIGKHQVYDLLDRIQGRTFFLTLLGLGRDWLDFDPTPWHSGELPDGSAMLADMLDAGIYGQTTMDRKHSGAVSLQAAAGAKPSLAATLFPSAGALAGRYPVLKKAPYLLPALWVHRIGSYGVEVLKHRGTSSPAGAVALSQQRLELMRRYGILPQATTEDR